MVQSCQKLTFFCQLEVFWTFFKTWIWLPFSLAKCTNCESNRIHNLKINIIKLNLGSHWLCNWTLSLIPCALLFAVMNLSSNSFRNVVQSLKQNHYSKSRVLDFDNISSPFLIVPSLKNICVAHQKPVNVSLEISLWKSFGTNNFARWR